MRLEGVGSVLDDGLGSKLAAGEVGREEVLSAGDETGLGLELVLSNLTHLIFDSIAQPWEGGSTFLYSGCSSGVTDSKLASVNSLKVSLDVISTCTWSPSKPTQVHFIRLNGLQILLRNG